MNGYKCIRQLTLSLLNISGFIHTYIHMHTYMKLSHRIRFVIAIWVQVKYLMYGNLSWLKMHENWIPLEKRTLKAWLRIEFWHRGFQKLIWRCLVQFYFDAMLWSLTNAMLCMLLTNHALQCYAFMLVNGCLVLGLYILSCVWQKFSELEHGKCSISFTIGV